MFQGEHHAESAKGLQPQPATTVDQTALEREMETFERLMLKHGASKEEIRQGLMARMGVPTKPEKSSLYAVCARLRALRIILESMNPTLILEREPKKPIQ